MTIALSDKQQDTERKIKEAARSIFLHKGFEATRTRDIADAAGINLALLNYYFRSKRRLYEIITVETMQQFFSGIFEIMNSEVTSIDEKIESFVVHYTDLLKEGSHIPQFILNNVRQNPDTFLKKISTLNGVDNSYFFRQFREAQIKGEIPSIHPIHFLLNLLSLTVFPFVTQPIISASTGIDKKQFNQIVEKRKRLIPLWMKAMLEIK